MKKKRKTPNAQRSTLRSRATRNGLLFQRSRFATVFNVQWGNLVLVFMLMLTGCADTREWWNGTGKANTQATINLIASEAASIAEKTVYTKGLDAADVLAKNFNVQGFGDGLRTLETGLAPAGIAQIPHFIMNLRKIWLPPQQHYTDLAANVAALVEQKYLELHPTTDAQRVAIIEAVIKGLQTEAPALKAP